MLTFTIFVGIQAFALSLVGGSTIRCKLEDEKPWSYHGEENGPSAWGETFPDCYKRMQSPIDIKFADVVKDPNLKPLEFKNYDELLQYAQVMNFGDTVRIHFMGHGSVTVNGDEYLLSDLHFHWGSHYDVGTEHLFDSKAYAMEAHFVHRSMRQGEFAVVSVLYQESPSNNTAFQAISDLLPHIKFEQEASEPHQLANFNLAKLLPSLPFQYFRYDGSLTTPDCTEGVVWLVATEVLKIGSQQLNELRSLYSVPRSSDGSHAGCHLRDNYRPVQPLNDRKVTIST